MELGIGYCDLPNSWDSNPLNFRARFTGLSEEQYTKLENRIIFDDFSSGTDKLMAIQSIRKKFGRLD